MSALDLRPLVPALIVALTGVVVLVAQAFTPRERRAPSVALSVFGLVAALAAVVVVQGQGATSTGGSVLADDFAVFLQVVVLLVGLATVFLSPSYLEGSDAGRGEYYSLLLFAVVGMLGLVSTVELISLFVALEILSVSLYAMAGIQRDRLPGQEAALKYFVTGAFSSAFFLYGIALMYGVAGSTSLPRIGAALGAPREGMLLLAVVGAAFLLVGLGFKVASVPFHAWAPDVYEGAPTTVTAFMSAGVKVAAFGAFLRIFADALAPLAPRWQPAIAALAVLTMVVGNLGALAQTSLKRMLAYSSVAHAGYVLTAFVAARETAAEAVLFYLVAYSLVNVGTFGLIASLARDGREPATLDHLRGLGIRRPALAAAAAVFLISLTGVPISAGFVGKFHLFRAAVSGGYVSLAVVGVLTSVLSAYYYLRIVVYMYMHDPEGDDPWRRLTVPATLTLGAAAIFVLVLGAYPAPLLALARLAARSL